MLETIGWYVSLGFAILGVACWFGLWFFGIRAGMLRKPGVSWFSPGRRFGSGLTEAGVRAWKRGWACVLGFLLCWLLSVGIGIITGAFARVTHR
jgi:hypothetical protein